ncbi:mesenchyme-specific cell surface glycoprotein-like [Mytilus californianus]|uniref:mesenchyme-specific cell surface glycoprotein-like n=1 Tax=Mytilus californianus TaxID=6549 RepID=UPI002247C360|nr:mesenchyme-specific cell surface glycoprotein-like [Mytilus californianus]
MGCIVQGAALLYYEKTGRGKRISTLYLPDSYDKDGTPLYKYSSGAIEQTTYDPDNYIVYAVGGNILHVIDVENVTSPKILHHIAIDDVDLTDIEYCGGHVFVSMDNDAFKAQGRVVVFSNFSTSELMVEKYNITVGPSPDMLSPTKDCKTILVAVEAQAYHDIETIIDPEGGVGIIKIENDNATYKMLDFKEFNSKWSKLESKGLRFIHRVNNNNFSNDVEPEYIAYNKDYSKAYICLQENNAIAVVDIASETIEDILPLGYKSWEKLMIDPSDKDGINMRSWPIYSMYQPDAIHVIYVAGKGYLVTSNEGDSKDYSDWGGFNEEERVRDIILSENSPIVKWAADQNFSSTIQDDNMLGRLKITNMNGRNDNGTYDELYAFGGRGFSIRKLETMELVYDSGDQFEKLQQQYIPQLFNNNCRKRYKTVNQTMDARSDDKGPESESLAVAHIGSELLIFVGNERPGSIFIYKITDDASKPEFQSIWNGVQETDGTWEELYDREMLSEVDPEDIRYIPADKSPNKQHILAVAGSVSGTFSMFRINGIKES